MVEIAVSLFLGIGSLIFFLAGIRTQRALRRLQYWILMLVGIGAILHDGGDHFLYFITFLTAIALFLEGVNSFHEKD